MYQVKFADIGEGLTEGKVGQVLVKPGDHIKAGDPLFAVETDKVNSDIPSPTSGTVAKVNISPDQDIKVGDVVVEIDDGSADRLAEPASTLVASPKVVTPVVSQPVEKPAVSRQEPVSGSLKASPLARKVAAAKGIDLTTVIPSGPNGRILVADVEQAAQNSTGVIAPSAKTTTIIDKDLSWDVVEMNGIRRATVKAMSLSHEQNAAFTGMRDVDITPVYDLRQEIKPLAEAKGIKLTYLAFIVRAVALALKDFPNINIRADFEKQEILEIHNINIGIAVDTPQGLLVPVIKNADQLSLFEIAHQIQELASKSRDRKLTMSEMSDATFTISNFGSVKLDYATPIINSPQEAILGIGNMTKTPVYVGETIEPRYLMPFSITCDHRVIDGADAARFINQVQTYLANPLGLLV